MPAKNFVYRQVQQLLIHRDDQATAATALTAGAAAGALTVTVASITGLASGDTFRVGSGEDLELHKINGAPSGSVVTLLKPLSKAHVIGESCRRQISYDFGDPTDDGLTVTADVDNLDVLSAVRRTVFAQIRGFARASIEGSYTAFSIHTLSAVLGMLASRVTGAGTVASPYHLITAGDEFGEDVNTSVSVTGVLVDGTTMHIELHGTDFDHTAVKGTIARGQLASLPFRAKASSQMVWDTVSPAYTVNTTFKAGRGRVFDALSEVGLYAPAAGMTSTLSVAAAAGANSFTVVSSTGAAVGDRVKFGTGENAEIHIIDTIPDATHVTTRTRTLRAFAIGATVVEQSQTPFGGVSEEGVSVEVSGDKRDVKLATKRFEAGSIPGTSIISLSWMLIDFLLANIAYALGVPQSAIVSGRLVVGNNLGTSDIGEVYSRGLQLDGTTLEIDACGCSQQVTSFAQKLSQKDIAKQPLTVRPTSCLIVRQYL